MDDELKYGIWLVFCVLCYFGSLICATDHILLTQIIGGVSTIVALCLGITYWKLWSYF